MRLLLSLLVLLAVWSNTVVAQTKELTSLKALASIPMISSPQISPDGKNIAGLSPDGNKLSVIVAAYGSQEFNRVVKLESEEDRIESIDWINDERLLVYASYSQRLRGQKIRVYRLFALNMDGSKLETMQVSRSMRHDDYQYFSGIDVISMLPKDPKHILVTAYTKLDDFPAVFKVNVYDGTFTKQVSAVQYVGDWIANNKGEVITGVKRWYNSSTQKDEVSILYRKDISKEDWQVIYKYSPGEDSFLRVIAVIDDTTLAVVTDAGANQKVLREFDIVTKAFGDIIFQVEGYDLDSAIVKDGKLVGYSYIDDYYRIKYFDEELAQRQETMKATFKDFETYVASSSKDKQRLIVGLASDSKPTKFYLVDLTEGKASAWMSQYPGLEGIRLPGKLKFSFETKDGVTLNGYFTQGTDWEQSPLIVLPHGGPHKRDTQYFDIWVQLLARRGYAVLQVNFRGSEGYGSGFEVSGRKQWGKLMQQDVYEAVDWVKANVLADTSNACIVGASYGGYVALTAGFQKPDMFKCVASINGIADIPGMISKDSAWGGGSKARIKRFIGDVDDATELADLKNNSAINHVAKFKAPVLLIHSENDTRVNYSQGENFYDKLDDAGKEVEYILLKDGTHFIDSPENRVIAFTAIDKFIAKHLGK